MAGSFDGGGGSSPEPPATRRGRARPARRRSGGYFRRLSGGRLWPRQSLADVRLLSFADHAGRPDAAFDRMAPITAISSSRAFPTVAPDRGEWNYRHIFAHIDGWAGTGRWAPNTSRKGPTSASLGWMETALTGGGQRAVEKKLSSPKFPGFQRQRQGPRRLARTRARPARSRPRHSARSRQSALVIAPEVSPRRRQKRATPKPARQRGGAGQRVPRPAHRRALGLNAQPARRRPPAGSAVPWMMGVSPAARRAANDRPCRHRHLPPAAADQASAPGRGRIFRDLTARHRRTTARQHQRRALRQRGQGVGAAAGPSRPAARHAGQMPGKALLPVSSGR